MAWSPTAYGASYEAGMQLVYQRVEGPYGFYVQQKQCVFRSLSSLILINNEASNTSTPTKFSVPWRPALNTGLGPCKRYSFSLETYILHATLEFTSICLEPPCILLHGQANMAVRAVGFLVRLTNGISNTLLSQIFSRFWTQAGGDEKYIYAKFYTTVTRSY
jgi:hypothetical protein